MNVDPKFAEENDRLDMMRRWSAVGVGVVALIMFWFALTTPDIDDLPQYDCVPGHHHTTEECQ